MKKILIVFAFVIIWPIGVCSQIIDNVYDEFGAIYTSINDSTIIYNTKKGKKYEVKLNEIYYKDGEDSLKKYLKTEYCKSDNSDDYAYRVFFFMLFDSKLRIKEIRGVVLPLGQYSESKKKRVESYIKRLKRTRNRWKKRINQKWYVYSFSFITE